MSREERASLNAQIAADPRVQQLVQREQRGSIPVYLNGAALRELGYTVPDGWKWTSGGGRIQPGLFEERGTPAGLIGAGAAALIGLAVSLVTWWRNRTSV